MCGIAGALDLRGSRLFSIDRLRAMTRAIAHRGPDDEHFHTEPGLVLGARRLSIVDLSGGRQPLSNESGDVWVAYNGELFDYPELQTELQSKGHQLSTRCDTEIWAHMYEEAGSGMFERLTGQFAVSLWDQKQKTLFLGRDRVGICPLFYTVRDGWLLWGSEVKALLASGMVEARPNPDAINHFFAFFATNQSSSFFEGVNSVQPGHYLKIQDGRIEAVRYWDLDFPDNGDERRYADPRQAADEMEQILRSAVRRRLRGDVPVVSYLSGGVDSSTILSLGSQERGTPLRSFTVGLNKAGYDERTQAAKTAKWLDSELTTLGLGHEEISNAYPELIQAAEAPVLDTACGCLLRLASQVRQEGFKVALTGEGADEALAGYFWFKSQMTREKFVRRFGRMIPTALRHLLLGSIGGGSAHRFPRQALNGIRVAQQDAADFIGQTREQLFTPELWRSIAGHSPFEDLSPLHDRFTRWHPLNQSLYIGYKSMLPGMLLSSKGDRVTMNSSIEARYPFLDEGFIAFCSQLAPEYKLRGRTEKWLLRQVAARILPAESANRKKHMFRASMSASFLGQGRPTWVDQLLSPESLRLAGYFQPDAVIKARRILSTRPHNTPYRLAMDMGLTSVLAMQLWHHTFCGGYLADLPSWSPPDSNPPVSLKIPPSIFSTSSKSRSA